MQNIDDICFSDEGPLKTEFSRLYVSLFDQAERHIAVIRALAKGQQGLTRPDILKAAKLPDSGSSSRVLEELIESGMLLRVFWRICFINSGFSYTDAVIH
jgi:uncharacterized protein